MLRLLGETRLLLNRRRDVGRGTHRISHHVRIVDIIDDFAIVKLDVEILVDGVHCTADGQVILQFYCYFLADQLFEIREEQLR